MGSAGRVAFIFVASVGLASASCRAARVDLPHAACRGCNVLLVTIDTLRADRVGAFGGPQGLTPALDRIASEGLRLTRAYAAAPITLPSHATILTAVSPPAHGLRANGLFRLGPTVPTLATVLKDAGYATGAFVGAFVLDARFGLNRGFDVYDDRYGETHAGDPTDVAERRAEDVIKPALDWVLSLNHQPQTPQPWFMWIHLYDPHEPYRAPEPYGSQHAPYDAEIAYTDANIAKLRSTLDTAHQLDRTLIVIAADHGESLGAHNERTHGVFAYDATLHIPWMLWARSRIAPGGWNGLARLTDLAPTTLDLVGVAAPVAFEGQSLVERIAANDLSGPPAYFEAMDANLTRNWAPLTGIIYGTEKLIDLPMPELYDLAADPGETNNLFAANPGRVRTLDALLRRTRESISQRGNSAEPTSLDAASRQRLRALGYVGSSADAAPRRYTVADDPKTLIDAAEQLSAAVGTFNGGSRSSAMIQVHEILRQHPNMLIASTELASMQRRTGDVRGAIATLENVVRGGVSDFRIMVVLAGYLDEAGEHDKAMKLLDAVIAAHPDNADAHNSLGVIAMRRGSHELARRSFRKVLEIDPTSATAYANLGADDLARGEWASAISDLSQAVSLDPHQFDALFNLALALDKVGRRQEAEEYARRFVRDAPQPQYAAEARQLSAALGTKK